MLQAEVAGSIRRELFPRGGGLGRGDHVGELAGLVQARARRWVLDLSTASMARAGLFPYIPPPNCRTSSRTVGPLLPL